MSERAKERSGAERSEASGVELSEKSGVERSEAKCFGEMNF